MSLVRTEPFWCLTDLHDKDAIIRKGVVESLHDCVIAVEGQGKRNFGLGVTEKRSKNRKDSK
jgi:hypothetical protein